MKVILVVLVVVLLSTILYAQNVSLTPSVLNVASTAVSTNCPAPQAGMTTYCFAGDKLLVAGNGTAYVTVWPTPAASIPTKVTIPAVTLPLQ